MSKEAAALVDKIKSLNDKGIGRLEMATIQAVDKNKNTCAVLLNDLPEPVTDVRLKATMNGNSSFIVYPAQGSDVMIERVLRIVRERNAAVAVSGFPLASTVGDPPLKNAILSLPRMGG
jgi:hypothetical protein